MMATGSSYFAYHDDRLVYISNVATLLHSSHQTYVNTRRHTTTRHAMEKTYIRRRVFPGAPVKTGYRIVSVEAAPLPDKYVPTETMSVNTLEEYSSGCKQHRDCFGHMCLTNDNALLPPHSFSFRTGEVKNQFYAAAHHAFRGDMSAYVKELKTTCYKKHGVLRSIMSTPVAGCARLVVVPHCYDDPNVIFISENLARKIKFCHYSATGEYTDDTYTERHLQEGDYVMLERPPSLTKYNNQPLRVSMVGWNIDALGVHPHVFKAFHGDYDGDESHIYVLANPESIKECERWNVPLVKDFEDAKDELYPYTDSNSPIPQGKGDMDFLKYTTVSFNQVKAGGVVPLVGDKVRCKESHLKMLTDRMARNAGTRGFLQEARQGVKDIMRQQLSQGIIGEMSRVARIAASCFVRQRTGSTIVLRSKGPLVVNSSTLPSDGVPSVRGIMLLCSVAQQSALDAHRVGSKASSTIDLVSDLLKGRSSDSDNGRRISLCIFNATEEEQIISLFECVWKYKDENYIFALLFDDTVTHSNSRYVVGAYSPVILAKCTTNRRKNVCRCGISVVYNYYHLEPEGDDMEDLVELFSYDVVASPLPITTRRGMMARKLAWVDTLLATDYTKMGALTGTTASAHSISTAVLASNYDML